MINMDKYSLTKEQARRFLLMKHGLVGDHKFIGKNGVLEFVNQAGCIQYDPIDVCGKNAELVLQSRVRGFQKSMLYSLLYEDRTLIDYFDKNLAVFKTEDWKYFDRIRDSFRMRSRGREEVAPVEAAIRELIAEKGPVCSKDIGLNDKVDWYWSRTKLSRAALETMYFRGELIVHHKKGTNKYYALAKDFIPSLLLEAQNPNHNEKEHMKWWVLRRISSVGLLWNRASDAWLNIDKLKAPLRNEIFEEMTDEGRLIKVSVEGVKDSLYCNTQDHLLIDEVCSGVKPIARTEFIAPLDNLIWDRRLIQELFDFHYKWEIYTPEKDRSYGYYVLPILHGEAFVGRIEVICNRKEKKLVVKNIWLEQGISMNEELWQGLNDCIERFRGFHELESIGYLIDWRVNEAL